MVLRVLGKIKVCKKIRQANDPVRWCSNFMAHSDKKYAFCALPFLGEKLRMGELLFMRFDRSDISLNRDDHFN